MESDSRITWLRASYRIGAVADGIAALLMLMPALGELLSGPPSSGSEADYAHALALAGALMAGWACLLMWADRDPIARKGVLLLTAVPTVLQLAIPGIYAEVAGFRNLEVLRFGWLVQAAILALFIVSYMKARSTDGQ